ncbi:glutamate ABC transporter substrate-binding protein [Pseudonocardia sp.]|uniref:glutamate ABC transporter substrate-binding protein n=1 Tax=Pseudonocardia sp. TaxID=60912 RepID=UPI00263A064E|nr:glutamate ABC transporter substrate-binding protein [Pseudonocardia sp.]MCW2718444.1 Glutamate transport system substrate-binding protein [Pseudonocardia sp.]MDT7612969.1 glutamate transport system substrate-binding protein [Pseudonocardiales bacterium]
MIRSARRLHLLAVAAAAALALAACADDGSAPALPGQADTSTYDAVIAGSPVADPSAIAAGSWADKIKQRGTLNVGGTDAGPLFSLKDPATGKVTGFDAGLSQMLAHYITGKTGNATQLTITTVDTRETLLQNNTVDAVFATYTITPQRAQKVAFAGPYYESGDAIMVKADNTSIRGVGDLAGKTVATEANSTAVLALQKAVPTAKTLLFQEDAQCVAAVQQGRADAYVLDQGILISDASTNPAVKVVGTPFTQEPYGVGLPLNDPTAKAFVNDWLQKIYADGSWAKLWKATIGTVVKGDAPAPPAIGSADGA